MTAVKRARNRDSELLAFPLWTLGKPPHMGLFQGVFIHINPRRGISNWNHIMPSFLLVRLSLRTKYFEVKTWDLVHIRIKRHISLVFWRGKIHLWACVCWCMSKQLGHQLLWITFRGFSLSYPVTDGIGRKANQTQFSAKSFVLIIYSLEKRSLPF